MKIKDGFVLRQIVGEWMAVAVGTRTAEFPGLIALSETAAFVWYLLETDTTVERLIEQVTDEFDVDHETAEQDVRRFITELKEKDLLENE